LWSVLEAVSLCIASPTCSFHHQFNPSATIAIASTSTSTHGGCAGD
jgi:hypothetical protein